MENLIASAGQYGALGLTLLASFWYINKKDAEHREEREEMRATLEKQHQDALTVIQENTRATTELTTIIKSK